MERPAELSKLIIGRDGRMFDDFASRNLVGDGRETQNVGGQRPANPKRRER